MDKLIGQTIGRYQMLEALGQGGMAAVYKARDTRLGRDVAIKFIRQELFMGEEGERVRQRFEREAHAMGQLSHPNIVSVLDYGEHEGQPYLVMPFIAGGSLKQLMGKPMPWKQAADLLIPIANALEYAHRKGIVHRDLKPANILLTDGGMPMVSDFGIVKLVETEQTGSLTGTGMGMGTPDYMAPEQWTGDATQATDIYSLGVVLYELLTGHRPYEAGTPAGVLLKQASEPPTPPTRFVQNLPPQAENTLATALARKPEQRFPSMEAFARALGGLPAPQPERAPAAGAPASPPSARTAVDGYPPAPPAKKTSRTWVIIAAAIGSVLCIGVVTLLLISGLLLGQPATPTAQPQRTQTPAAEVLFSDDFSDPASGWSSSTTADIISEYNGSGAYRIRVNTAQLDVWSIPAPTFDGDIAIEVDATKIGGPDDNDFGVLCRYSKNTDTQTSSYYYFLISSDGYAVIARLLNGESKNISADKWQRNASINTGAATNHIRAVCAGSDLRMVVNGQPVVSASDSSLPATGGAGVIAGTFATTGVDILFDNFVVTRP